MSFIRNQTSINSWNTTTAMLTTAPSSWKYDWASQAGTTTTCKAGETIVNGAISGTSGSATTFYWSTATERAQYGQMYWAAGQVLSSSCDESISNGIEFTITNAGSRIDTTASRVHIWRLL